MNREIVRQRRHLMLIMVKFPYHDALGIKNHMYQSNKSEKEGEIGTASLFVKLFLHKKLFMQFKII